ncbi:MAG: metal ABC transporter substrate-binding protein [Chromatiales bacterium]|nr:metal ABC transporter substrate-binding protein [Chromatiales bacterium]
MSSQALSRIAAALTLLLLASPVWARLDVVATTSSMGMLARVVGGEAVRVSVLAPPDRDAHHLQARPSMLAALRRADLVVAVGAELEVGWLPAALQGAGNPRVNPGRPGYFEAAAQMPLLGAGAAADRSQGDVHPHGNPHIQLDPERMATAAAALSKRMAMLAPDDASRFAANAERFAQAVGARVPAWRSAAKSAPGVVFHHQDGDYLAAFLGVPVLGYIEPLPGIPPTARHLQALVQSLVGRKGVILRAEFAPPQGAGFVARATGWPSHALPLEPPLDADTNQWIAFIDRWVQAIATGS